MEDTAPACPVPTRRPWRARDLVELTLIALVPLGLYLAQVGAGWRPRFGEAVCYACAVILGQGLLRDLALLWARRKGDAKPKRRAACLCAESTLGLSLLAVGATVLLLGIEERVTLTPGRLGLTLWVLLGVGFVAKDYVLSVRREEDHGSVIVF